jgi:hypothetical protein
MTAAQDHDRIIGLVIHHCFASFHVRPWPKEQLTQKNLQILWGRFGGSILDWPVVFPRIGNALALIQKSTALEPVYAIEAQKIFAEFPVIMPDNHVAHQCRQIVIDKLILDTQGRYWIIEWKTGHAWQKSWEHYRQQLQQYAQAVMRALECHQPKIALYIMAADRLYIFDSCDDIPLYID